MATVQQEQKLPPEPKVSQRELDVAARRQAGIRQAHEAVMLGDAAELLQDNRLKTAGNGERKPMQIHVGDLINQPPQAKAALGNLAKAGIAAALLGSGAAIPLAIDLFAGDDKPAASAPVPMDTDTWMNLRMLPMPEKQK